MITDDDGDTDEPSTGGENSTLNEQFESYIANLNRSNALTQASQSSAIRKSISILETELCTFDSLSRISANIQIMDFWKNQKQLPVLKEIALDIISVPVTEVSVERMFSLLKLFLIILNSVKMGLDQTDLISKSSTIPSMKARKKRTMKIRKYR